MQYSGSLFAAAMLLVGFSTPAFAQQSGIFYDCDTAQGRFSQSLLPAPGQAFTVTGRIKLVQPAATGEYLPILSVAIGNRGADGRPDRPGVGVSLVAIPARLVSGAQRRGNAPVQVFSWDVIPDSGDARRVPIGPANADGIYPFSLGYDGQTVTVRVGTEERRSALTAANPLVKINCSTGEFQLMDLVITPTQ